jgi:hypothetical protein
VTRSLAPDENALIAGLAEGLAEAVDEYEQFEHRITHDDADELGLVLSVAADRTRKAIRLGEVPKEIADGVKLRVERLNAAVRCASTGADGNRDNRRNAGPSHDFGNVAVHGGAESGAHAVETAEFDPDLTRVVEAWPMLAGDVRRAILDLTGGGTH